MRRLAFILTFIAMAGASGPAGAERLVVSLSNHRVAVTSNFVGEELVLFGTIEPDPATALLHPPYDLVVTVSGPRQTLRTRRKQRMAGIWVNVDSREFVRRADLSRRAQQPSGHRNRPRGYVAAAADRPR